MIARFIRILPGLGRQVPPLFYLRCKMKPSRNWVGPGLDSGQRIRMINACYWLQSSMLLPRNPYTNKQTKNLRSGCTKAATPSILTSTADTNVIIQSSYCKACHCLQGHNHCSIVDLPRSLSNTAQGRLESQMTPHKKHMHMFSPYRLIKGPFCVLLSLLPYIKHRFVPR